MLNIKGLYLDNFRIFSETSHIRLAPVTILTGPNNSGKSTIAGSLAMMKDLDTGSFPYRLRFDSGKNPYNSFGTIRNYRNAGRRSTLGYDIYNILLGEVVNVSLTFEKDNEFDAVVRNIRFKNSTETLFDFKFEKERIVAEVNMGYMLSKLRQVKSGRSRYAELERNFRNIRSESGSYKNGVTEKRIEKDEASIKIFHVDNDLKRKNLLSFLKGQEITTEEYERLHYFFGRRRNMPPKGSQEEEYLEGAHRVISEFDENEILLNSNLVKKIAGVPSAKLKESDLRNMIKTFFPDLYDCLLLLNNPDQFSKVTDLLRQKSYSEWEKEFIDDEITTSQRITSLETQKRLSRITEQHIQILFGESNLFMALTDLASSRQGFLKVFDEYRNLKALSDFCGLVVDKTMHDLKSDIDKSVSIPVVSHNHEAAVGFNDPLYHLAKKHVSSRKKGGFLASWLKKFNLCDDLFFETPVKGLGYFPGLKKKREQIPLSGESSGARRLIMMLLEISGSSNKCELHDYNGESANYPGSVMLEEPEARLHPAWQSKLADMFVDAREEFGYHFLIETYSEYLIRKLQFLVSAGQIDRNDVVIYYFDSGNCEGGDQKIREISICSDGSLSEEFGPGFLYENHVEILKLKKVNKN
jgi:AAA15 family ATPase/GTPase